MSDEAQLTFDDIVSSVPDELYASVSKIADAIVEEDRVRRGDNCATISVSQSVDTYTFCILLPPRTTRISKQTMTTAVEEVSVTFENSNVFVDKSPVYVVWKFSCTHREFDEAFTIVIVRPVEDGTLDSDDVSRDVYESFEFTDFVRQSEFNLL